MNEGRGLLKLEWRLRRYTSADFHELFSDKGNAVEGFHLPLRWERQKKWGSLREASSHLACTRPILYAEMASRFICIFISGLTNMHPLSTMKPYCCSPHKRQATETAVPCCYASHLSFQPHPVEIREATGLCGLSERDTGERRGRRTSRCFPFLKLLISTAPLPFFAKSN